MEIAEASMPVSRPHAVQVEITSRCNLACTMCPLTTGGTDSAVTPGHIHDAVWQQVLRAVDDAHSVFVAGFGEPLVNPRWRELMSDLDATNAAMTFVTNAIALRPAAAEHLAKLSGLRHINVSIDSPDPDVYRAVRGGDVRKAIAGLTNLMQHVGGPDNPVSVSSVAMVDNLPSLRAMPQLLADLGVKHYLLQGLMDYNDYASGQHPLADPVAQQALADIEDECRRLGITLAITLSDQVGATPEIPVGEIGRTALTIATNDGAPDHQTSRVCTLPWEQPYIDKDGRVFACCFSAAIGADDLGAIGERSVDDVWHDEPFNAFRAGLLRGGEHLPKSCQGCTAVPVGPHPLAEFGAEIVSTHYDPRDHQVRVLARNTGDRPFTDQVPLALGTVKPVDRASGWVSQGWEAPNRPASTRSRVEAGQTAVLQFNVPDLPHTSTERFQLVAEGVCWLPGTDIELTIGSVRVPTRRQKIGQWLATDGEALADRGRVMVARGGPWRAPGVLVRKTGTAIRLAGQRVCMWSAD